MQGVDAAAACPLAFAGGVPAVGLYGEIEREWETTESH